MLENTGANSAPHQAFCICFCSSETSYEPGLYLTIFLKSLSRISSYKFNTLILSRMLGSLYLEE